MDWIIGITSERQDANGASFRIKMLFFYHS